MYLCINIYSYIDRQTDRQLDRQIFIYVLSRSKVYDPPPPSPTLTPVCAAGYRRAGGEGSVRQVQV